MVNHLNRYLFKPDWEMISSIGSFIFPIINCLGSYNSILKDHDEEPQMLFKGVIGLFTWHFMRFMGVLYMIRIGVCAYSDTPIFSQSFVEGSIGAIIAYIILLNVMCFDRIANRICERFKNER